MKRIIGWLGSILTRQRVSDTDDRADDNTDDAQSETEAAAPIVNQEDESAVTVPHLEVLDFDLSDTDNLTGIDPYDTAQLHKK